MKMFYNKAAFEAQIESLGDKITEKDTTALRALRSDISENNTVESYIDDIEELIERLFYLPYLDKKILTWDFLRSPIGEMITYTLYSTESDVISTDLIASHMNVTNQYVTKLLRNDEIKGMKTPNGWKVTKSAANVYLSQKGKPIMK